MSGKVHTYAAPSMTVRRVPITGPSVTPSAARKRGLLLCLAACSHHDNPARHAQVKNVRRKITLKSYGLYGDRLRRALNHAVFAGPPKAAPQVRPVPPSGLTPEQKAKWAAVLRKTKTL